VFDGVNGVETNGANIHGSVECIINETVPEEEGVEESGLGVFELRRVHVIEGRGGVVNISGSEETFKISGVGSKVITGGGSRRVLARSGVGLLAAAAAITFALRVRG
jgi:hypothetical protein